MNPSFGGETPRAPLGRFNWLVPVVGATWVLTASAHVLSVSQGSLTLEGLSAQYELRMPLTEVPDTPDREQVLLGALGVRSGESAGRRQDGTCSEEPGQPFLICRSAFHFERPPSKVTVRCDLPSVTVPHHVHILRSGTGEVARQTVFDITVREAEIPFVPPTWVETTLTEFGAGVRRAVTSPELILFLLGLALAGRKANELVWCVGAFLAAQAVVALSGSLIGWRLPGGFLEAAAALTVAYVASEVLFLPDAKNRWVVCGALGCFHGLFLGAFVNTAQMNPVLVLPGALGVELLLAGILGTVRLRIVSGRSEQLLALLLLVLGLGWFALRVIG